MKKLHLRKETLTNLTDDQAAELVGGGRRPRFSAKGCQFSDLCPTSILPSRCTSRACD